MAERYDIYSRGSSGWTISTRNEEFQEDDVWAVFKERKDFNSKVAGNPKELSSNVSTRPLPSAARMIPRPISNYNSSSAVDQPKWVQQSAPVNIPDWSKIYGKHSKKAYQNSVWLDHDHDYDRNGYDADADADADAEYGNGRRGSDSDEDDSMMIPPHEWIAKKLARSEISSFSVCEGVGRTLKGRDLSRVRNAVLSRTGFLE